MNGRNKAAQWIVAIGAFILLVGSGMHLAGGYPQLSKTLAAAPLDAGFKAVVRAVFLLIGWEWIILAIITVIAAFTETAIRKPIVLLCGFSLLVTAAAMVKFVGWFIGTDLTLASAVLIIIGGFALAPAQSRVAAPEVSSRIA